MDERFVYKELVYDGKVAKAHRVRVRMPDGQIVERDWIHYNGAALVLPILDDGSIVLIRNYRFAVGETLYELPAGMMDHEGESPEQCALRELAEETGYTAGRIEPLGAFYTGPGTCDERMYAFVARELAPGRQRLEAYERIETEVVPEPEVRAMVADGRIHDAKTIAALGLYWLREGLVAGQARGAE